MTPGTAALRTRRAVHVLRVVKLYVEWFFEACRKTFQWRIVTAYVRVADRAHRNLRCCELAAMTVGAGFVAGKPRRR